MAVKSVSFEDLEISIEREAGEVRTGVSAFDGKEWESTTHHDYGYIKGTHSPDGEHLDCYLAPNPKEGSVVYIVHQLTPDGSSYDEDKVMLGFKSLEDAREAFKKNAFKPSKMIGQISEMNMDHFKVCAYQASNSSCFIGSEHNYEILKDKGLIKGSIKSPVSLAKKISEHYEIRQGNRVIGTFPSKELAESRLSRQPESVQRLYEINFVSDDARKNRIINEGLQMGDLEHILLPRISFDEYVDDSGEEKNVVLAFFIRNVPEAVEPLRTFCDLYKDVVYTDTGDSETIKNTSIVYVEFCRKDLDYRSVVELIEQVANVANMKVEDMNVRFPKNNTFPFSPKALKSYIEQVVHVQGEKEEEKELLS
jgi:hypothetical protein